MADMAIAALQRYSNKTVGMSITSVSKGSGDGRGYESRINSRSGADSGSTMALAFENGLSTEITSGPTTSFKIGLRMAGHSRC